MEQVNLRAMQTIRDAFGIPVGYSDHTEGIAVSLAAVALGAECIEKHFTLDRNMPGPDHKASLEPSELKQLISSIHQVELAKGCTLKRVQPGEVSTRVVARKSLVAKVPIKKGEPFSDSNLSAKRPGSGVSPMEIFEVIGRPATRDYAEDELIDNI